MANLSQSRDTRVASARRTLFVAATLVWTVLACGREPTSSGERLNSGVLRYSQGLSWVAQFPQGYPVLQASGANQVAFNRVRIVLNNPDGSVAKDTVIEFPPGVDEKTLTLSLPLPASAPATGLPLALTLKYVNAQGDTVFSGGPVTVNAVPALPGAGPPPPSAVPITLSYTGPGASATRVAISPRTLTVNTNGTFNVSAQAMDATGSVIPNTPIFFSVDNQVLASVNGTTGAGTAGSVRGTTTVRAQLLTGPADAANLTIRAVPTTLTLVSGGAQTANVNATLPNPVVVRVDANDGIGVDGVSVTFGTSGGGTVGGGASATVTTDAAGLASTNWKLGGTAGTQSLTASVAGVSGSPVTVTATARALDPVRLLIATQPPASTQAGASFGIVANAVDATGTVAPGFTGAVTVSLAAGAPPGAVLSGSTTVNAIAGVAAFSDLRLNVAGTYVLDVRTPSLIAAGSSGFAIVPGPARRLVFQGYPVAGVTAGSTFDPVTVQVRDSLNNPVTTYTGPVTIVVSDPSAALVASRIRASMSPVMTPPSPMPANASISTLATVNAVGGVATFEGLRLTVTGTYQLIASASGLTSATGPSFAVSPGPAARLMITSGSGQAAIGGATLPTPVGVRVADAFGNAVPGAGRTIAFAASAGGSASPASGTTNAVGQLSTVWTLGATAGSQTLTASSAGLTSAVASATASGAAPTGPTGPTYGFPVVFSTPSSHSPNFLLGSLISVPTTSTLTHISLIAKSGGQQVVMALYSNVSGSPGTLLASSAATTVVVGVNDLPVSNIVLPVGNYWIMGVFNVQASVGIDFANSDIVKYISFSFGSPLPTTFPTPIVYSGQRFNYYIRVQGAQ